jgi:DNA-binding response OmpR family regulator
MMSSESEQTLLIVEDQQDVQKLLSLALAKPNRRILQALDAEEGARLTFAEHPDLILLDIMMPGQMDGLDLLREIRNDSEVRSTPVIILSARAQNSDRKIAIEAGADDYLIKPFRLAELQAMMDRYLQ